MWYEAIFYRKNYNQYFDFKEIMKNFKHMLVSGFQYSKKLTVHLPNHQIYYDKI